MFPVLLKLGPFHIFSYGALVALGGMLTAFFWRSRRSQMGFKKDEEYWLFLNVILFSGFLGGRVLFLIEYVPWSHPDYMDAVLSFSRGFSMLGAFGGIVTGIWLFCRRGKLEFLRVMDYVCLGAPFWHIFGKLGCFAAGCCYGRPTSLPWGVTFHDPRAMVPPDLLGVPLHPTQLYESFAALVTTVILYKFVLLPIEAGKRKPGALMGGYFILYGMLRFGMEYLRGDAIQVASGISAGQAICLVLIGVGGAVVCTRS